MPNDVYLGSRRLTLDPKKILGEGGEAVVYDLGTDVLKLYKGPDHPSYEGDDPGNQRNREVAAQRLRYIEEKLRAFPKGLPNTVIAPLELATDRLQRQVLGFIMKKLTNGVLIRELGKPKGRPAGVGQNEVVATYRGLHGTVSGIHPAQVVIGDFNHLNVIVINGVAYLIDADSLQFGKWVCKTFTTKFVDPLICDPKEKALIQVKAHTPETDWYAFGVMLFESMMKIHPYLGVYAPKDKRKQVLPELRPLHRISVLNPDVKYPPFAVPLKALNDEVLHFYDGLLHKDERGAFPVKLLDTLRWTQCTQCGFEHAKSRCPECDIAAPAPAAAIKEQIRGKIRVTRIFDTAGSLLAARVHNNKLRYLFNVNGEFKREDASVVFRGEVRQGMRFDVQNERTLVAKDGRLVVFTPGSSPEQLLVDAYRDGSPVLDTNEHHYYWLQQGTLHRDDTLGSKYMGDVLQGQTKFWVGSRFGFGFYRAGNIQVAFVFDAERQGILDDVKLPQLRGQVLETHCYFSSRRAWFVVSTQEGPKTIHRCYTIDEKGKVIASAEAEDGDGSWLGDGGGKVAATLGSKGGTPINALFVAKDGGLVCVHEEGAALVERNEFPDTHGIIDSSHELLMDARGIYVVSKTNIRLVELIP